MIKSGKKNIAIESDRGRIGKQEGNHVKGAKAASLQRAKMVMILLPTFFFN